MRKSYKLGLTPTVLGTIFNYATWHEPPGGPPFWEYADHGGLISGSMTAIRSGKLAGGRYKVTIYGILICKSAYRVAK
jgi:hypothetical protein